MDAGTVGIVIPNEPSSAFDPGRDVKDRKLVQIFKRLHMEQDLDSLLPFEDIVSHPVEGISDQTEELNTEKVERSRPRKILDYALLAKGRSGNRNLVGSFGRNYSDVNGTDRRSSMSSSKRIRFKKRRYEEYAPNASPKGRSKNAQALASKKSHRLQRSSLPGTAELKAAHDNRKKETLRPRSLIQNTKGGILKKRHKHQADNVKQAYLIWENTATEEGQHFEEFSIPKEWIKEDNKPKVKKMKRDEASSSSSSSTSTAIEEQAMKHLLSALKRAKTLYPEAFAKYYPTLIDFFKEDESTEKKNGMMTRKKQSDVAKSRTLASENSAPDSGDDGVPKRARKMPKAFQDYDIGDEAQKKKLASHFPDVKKEKRDNVVKDEPRSAQKISRINGSSAGTSGLRKRSGASTDASGKVDMKQGTLDESMPAKKRGRSDMNANKASMIGEGKRKSGDEAVADSVIIQNNIEDSAAETSSDESSNVRTSKRQRAQSGFYKTMVTSYDNKR